MEVLRFVRCETDDSEGTLIFCCITREASAHDDGAAVVWEVRFKEQPIERALTAVEAHRVQRQYQQQQTELTKWNAAGVQCGADEDALSEVIDRDVFAGTWAERVVLAESAA